MSSSELPLLDAERMAIDEINASGGVLGCRIEPQVGDGESAPLAFARRAEELHRSGSKALFGCWTSASRKAVKRVVEEADSVLYYPVQYEGLEQSEHVFYLGSCLNQQVSPALEWVLEHLGLRVFLVGSDYVFPRVANQFIRSMVEGRPGGRIVAERYVSLGAVDFSAVVAEERGRLRKGPMKPSTAEDDHRERCRRKVLIIDDDVDLLDTISEVLEADGCDVEKARDGAEGLTAFERDEPDLILLDMKMPVMDGWEFARRFHELYGHRTPIVVVTAASDACARAADIGAEGWLDKPFALDALLQLVRRRGIQ